MCGIFGIFSQSKVSKSELAVLANYAQQRGKDSSGLFIYDDLKYKVLRADTPVSNLLAHAKYSNSQFIMGHSRLITNGLLDNQPIIRDNICVIHNGIIVNHEKLWSKINKSPNQEIDSEIIAAIAESHLANNADLSSIASEVLGLCEGVVACAVALPKLGKLCLFSNNGSLYIGHKSNNWYFSSERYPLSRLNCQSISQVRDGGIVLDIPSSFVTDEVSNSLAIRPNLIPSLASRSADEKILEYRQPNFQRCSRCILPETMPFIVFDDQGVCNYCRNYKSRNTPKPSSQLIELVKPYRTSSGDDCIVPFSGGRDSCYGLHLVVKELGLNPIAYTYDWGMVTDLGRRNISRMCAKLGIENIIIAANISRKRRNIYRNLKAWLASPHLGMVSILTAGDKHFFRHVETVKQQTGLSLNLWGVNPLEVTHFKSGFLGVPPNFQEERVYSHGALKQMRYQYLRLKAMSHSPRYFNRSLIDTLSGEYYRSFTEKKDYFHIFDYWRWDERLIDDTLLNEYSWEKAPDTNTTWRIGDGTAAFYNYIYYTVAGFSEHDTFRSNQIREGDISREEALILVEDENRPRHPNIKWYLDAVGVDYQEAVSVVNSIPKLYS